ncbi:serine hydrolase domain-containing protein [Umezawaea tangerina]|uniref:CubicO group peptidase (Beta-lactamase class C family) n=1 Tax=Umezawaea tangerina TaxID=84725 RepID=A0A2T0SZD0_9PSEU|nr:serine hydrolase domain-containing protein [Umezawaea tangerina]PRY38782.1 CubicO group peptidase (beta-lactamase class C family) [Umezawaea tangerina]
MRFDVARWQGRLDEEARRRRVPGASLAVLVDGQVHEVATGVLHRGTGVAVTADSVFQVGSISKVYTATLVMQLVEAGELELDATVLSVLPEFAVADAEATKSVTVRQLLTHTSGIDGDFFHDTGRGDDCVARYVEACAGLGQNHPPGATLSYCNSGFKILGRIVEVLTGRVWDEVLRERIVEPLGLTRTMTLPEEVLRFRAAMGHVGEPGEDPQPAPVWSLPRSIGPAGGICATAADVVRFAKAHLDGGAGILGAGVVEAMRRPEVEVPNRWRAATHWGLGWELFDWPGGPVFGHGGATIGQYAHLYAVPHRGVAVALLTNGGAVGGLFETVLGELLDELADVRMAHFEPPAVPPVVDYSGYLGTYRSAGMDFEVTDRDGRPHMRYRWLGETADLLPPHELDLVPVTDTLFAGRLHEEEQWLPLVFYTPAGAGPYLHFAMRAVPKVG